MSDDNTRDGAEPSPASAGSVSVERRDMRKEVLLPKGYEMTITPQPWIPIAERLPEDGDTVWAYEGGDYVFLADFSSGRFLSVGHQLDREGLNYEQYKGITHWMEVAMPPPPTDSK